MRLLTLDSSVVLKWFRADREQHREQALRLRDEFQAGRSRVVVPWLLGLEMLNVAGRQWAWGPTQLAELVHGLQGSRLEFVAPDLEQVAASVGRGLSAYDAAYVAIAVEHGATLVTDDQRILTLAPGIAVALAHAA